MENLHCILLVVLAIIIILFLWWLFSRPQPQQYTNFTITLSPSQVEPTVAPTPVASGVGGAGLTQDNKQLNYAFELRNITGQPTVELHQSGAGTNGPLVKSLNVENISDNTWISRGTWTASDIQPLTPELVQQLRNNNIYVVANTVDYPNGELRGQLIKSQ